MKIFFVFCFFSLVHSTIAHAVFQYPDERIYTSVDRGISPYNAKSIYHTQTFALTFDDGPHPTRTDLVLDTLKKYDVKAIFFVLTSNITPETLPIVKRALQEGHLIGSHMPIHDNSNTLDEKTFKARVKASFLALAKVYEAVGEPMTKFYFRFPYGAYGGRKDYHHINALREASKELLGENCINMVFWDIDSNDWVPGMTSKEVASNIIAESVGGTYVDFKQQGSQTIKVPYVITQPREGGVILQHDVQATTAEGGLELFLHYAKENGLRLSRVDEIDEFRDTKHCQLSPVL